MRVEKSGRFGRFIYKKNHKLLPPLENEPKLQSLIKHQ